MKYFTEIVRHPVFYTLLTIVLVAATWMRLSRIETHAVFFGDAGRDLLVAAQAVKDKELPLLGIPSSVPRFHQGPISIWIQMAIFLFFGYQLLPYSIVFAGIAIMAIIALYELTTTQLGKKAALASTFLLSFSPLAIAHARMPYHTTPIPLIMILYLWSLIRLWQGKPYSRFLSALAFAALFQFELSTLPFILLIPYIIWRKNLKWKKATEAGGWIIGLALGLLPQIIFDLTNNLKQLGGFSIWVIYRVASSIGGKHQFSGESIVGFADNFLLYNGRMFSTEIDIWAAIGFGILIISVYLSIKSVIRGKSPILVELSLISWVALTLGYLIHRSPSEAYFPPYFILNSVLIGYAVSQLPKRIWQSLGVISLVWAIAISQAIIQNSFFVSTSAKFNYGPGPGEQKSIIRLLNTTLEKGYYLDSSQNKQNFASYFNNFEWIAKSEDTRFEPWGRTVFIESKESSLSKYPNASKFSAPSVDLYLMPF